MLRVTEIAFGLEKTWNHRYRDAKLVPWHICLVAMMLGILCGDASGLSFNSITPHLFFIAISALSLTALRLIKRAVGQSFQFRHILFWLAAWMMLWFALGFWQILPKTEALPPENQSCTFVAKVESVPPASTSINLIISGWNCENAQTEGHFRARMTLPNTNAEQLTKDTIFSISGQFSRFEGPDVPGMFDATQWAHTQRLAGRIKIPPQSVPEILKKSESISAKLESARSSAFEKLSKASPHGIMPALILGSSKAITDDTRQTFGHLGIAHVLAVSGLHFGIIAILINAFFNAIFGRMPWIMRRFGKKRAAALASIPTLAIYLFFVGAPISAQRALLMFACCSFARIFASKSERMRSLCTAGIIILVLNPFALFEISFQLSFSAVLGIIWGMDFYEKELRMRIIECDIGKRMKKLACTCVSMLIMTISTSLTTAPFVIAHFSQLPVLGIFTNLLVIPYVSVVLMPVAMITSFFVIAEIPGAQFMTDIASICEKLLVESASFCDKTIPLTYTEITPHPVILVIAVFTAIALLYRFKFNKKRIIAALIATIAMTACIILVQINPRFFTQPDDLRITFVAMGQADSTLIEFPDGHVMLIDAGSELGKDENTTQTHLIPYLKKLGISRIDTLVLTHSDYDHVAGLPTLLENVKISQIWHNGLESHEWMQTAQNITLIDVIQNPPENDYHSADLEILWPKSDSKDYLQSVNAINPNESSIVMRLNYQDFSAIFAGDAGIVVEDKLIEHAMKPVTVLKAGHHGSKSASSQAFIDKLHPQMAVFSTGLHNRYRFPHDDVQTRFFHAKAQLFNTAESGSIRMTTNGQRLRIETMK